MRNHVLRYPGIMKENSPLARELKNNFTPRYEFFQHPDYLADLALADFSCISKYPPVKNDLGTSNVTSKIKAKHRFKIPTGCLTDSPNIQFLTRYVKSNDSPCYSTCQSHERNGRQELTTDWCQRWKNHGNSRVSNIRPSSGTSPSVRPNFFRGPRSAALQTIA